ncbi:unnamed protein product [Effrenium voratum]|uniref:RNA-editing substrate-binding complex 6 protein domain-containing protein n=1 Tax=Effrenium voratum TaxID=2562239 RepID=A0AA36HLF6_9DINO|nr:unnamed protein product [Effrenium voratum]
MAPVRPAWEGAKRSFGFMVPKSQRQAKGETGRLARQLSPSELSTAVRVASQGPRKHDLRMWREYAEATLFHAGALLPKHMAFIANGFARAEVPDRKVFSRLSDQAFNHVEDFEPRAYARLRFRDLALFQAFSGAIQRSPPTGFGEQQLALLCNAYARLEIADGDLFKKMSSWTVQKVTELTPQGAATVANAYAKVLLADKALFAALTEAISRNLADFSAQHLANLLNAYARLELRDTVAVGKLAQQIPNRARDFVPLELSQALHAIVKMGMASEQRRAMVCLAEAVQERAPEFHSRQLALTIHSFSMLNTSHGRLLQDLAPQVLATMGMADDQSTALLFCAYARAGQVQAEVLRGLMEKLLASAAGAGEQMQVQLFYACGRLGLHKEPLTIHLADLLRKSVPELSSQHVANCLLTLARVSLCSEEFAALLAALQARLLRRDLGFEPQQLANSMHALAGIHGEGAPPQGVPASLPGSVVQRLLENVKSGAGEWERNPQLLASVAISCARLRFSSVELFAWVSQTVRRATPCNLSKRNLSDLLSAYSVTGLFDLDLFSWVLSQLDAGGLQSVPMDCLMNTLRALDYASFSTEGQLEDTHWPEPDPSEPGESAQSLLFMQCPREFQTQATSFYERVGLAVLTHSRSLAPRMIQEVALPFARAGLLDSAVPCDLLSGPARDFLAAGASTPPQEPLLSPPGPDEAETRSGTEAPECLVDYLLEELNWQSGGSSSSTDGVRPARLLARYAALLPEEGSSKSKPSVPAAVLDPILRKLGNVLRDSADKLSFHELAGALATLADAGIRPNNVLEALGSAAEAFDRFQPSEAVAVAALLHGLQSSGRSLQPFRQRLGAFLDAWAQELSFPLGDRPLQVVARLLAAADHQLVKHQGDCLVQLLHSTLTEANASLHFEDLADLLRALCLLQEPASEMEELLKALQETSAVLQIRLCAAAASAKPERVLALLQALPVSPDSWSPQLLTALAERLLDDSQVLGGSGLAAALQAFARLRALDAGQAREEASQRLARAVASLMRSILVLDRRLSISEAARGAHFCAQVLDSRALTEAERAEAQAGLARLLERLCWERQRWSMEDRKLITEVATLLRSEYPELLSGRWVRLGAALGEAYRFLRNLVAAMVMAAWRLAWLPVAFCMRSRTETGQNVCMLTACLTADSATSVVIMALQDWQGMIPLRTEDLPGGDFKLRHQIALTTDAGEGHFCYSHLAGGFWAGAVMGAAVGGKVGAVGFWGGPLIGGVTSAFGAMAGAFAGGMVAKVVSGKAGANCGGVNLAVYSKRKVAVDIDVNDTDAVRAIRSSTTATTVKGTVAATFGISGRSLVMASTHGTEGVRGKKKAEPCQAAVAHPAERQRVLDFETALRSVNELRKNVSKAAVLWGGDFNPRTVQPLGSQAGCPVWPNSGDPEEDLANLRAGQDILGVGTAGELVTFRQLLHDQSLSEVQGLKCPTYKKISAEDVKPDKRTFGAKSTAAGCTTSHHIRPPGWIESFAAPTLHGFNAEKHSG